MSFIVSGAAGAAKGAGDAMMLKAKQDRDDMLLALEEQRKREDMATQEGYQKENIGQQGDIQKSLQTSQQEFQGGENQKNREAQAANVETEQKGASARSAAEIEGRHQDVNTQTKASIEAANIRAGWENQRSTINAQRYMQGGKPLTSANALLAARSTYKDMVAAGMAPTDESGNQIPADTWITNQADALMQKYGGGTSFTATAGVGGQPDYSGFSGSASLGGGGGGLLNQGGTSTVTPQPAAAPQQQTNRPPLSSFLTPQPASAPATWQ
jgi:hypothetical protein